MALYKNGDVWIRYLTVGQLKALLTQVDDDLLVTCSETTGGLVFYRSPTFEYDAMHSWMDFNFETLEPFEDDDEERAGR